MISRTRYGLAMLLLLAAGIGMAPLAHAQALPPDRGGSGRRGGNRRFRRRTTTDVEDLEPDWSQLNVDTATLLLGPASKPRSKARQPQASDGSDTSWTSTSKANGAAEMSVKQSLSPFWDTRIGADMTVVGPPQTLTSADLLRQKISGDGQPVAVLRHRMGGDHRPRRRLDLGQDRDRSPGRSRAGAGQARHQPQQVAAARRAVFAHLAERLQHHPAGHRPGARHRRAPVSAITRPSNRRS